MEVFNSKIDIWLLAILLVTVVISLVTAYKVTRQDKTAVKNYGIALFTALVGAGLPAWILMSTTYQISNDNLKVRSGPFSWVISISSISSVHETRNPLSSPALSLDRLEIKYGMDKSIMVSPVNKAEFRASIRQPGI